MSAGVEVRRHRRRLCRRVMGILLPIVRGGSAMGAVVVVDEPGLGLAAYACWKRLTGGLAAPDGSKAPGLASVQSLGAGRGSKPSIVACGTTMLIRFSTLVSSSPWSLPTNVNALPCAPIR